VDKFRNPAATPFAEWEKHQEEFSKRYPRGSVGKLPPIKDEEDIRMFLEGTGHTKGQDGIWRKQAGAPKGWRIIIKKKDHAYGN